MTKNTLGVKRACPSCSARFYDLGKNPATCPKCHTSFDVTAPVKPRRRARAALTEAEMNDPLVKAKARQEQKQKPKAPIREIEGVDLEEFEDIETLDTDEEIEEMEEMDDIESIKELEEIEEAGTEEEMDDDITLEDEDVGDEVLIDDLDEDEEDADGDEDEDEEEDEEDEKPKRSSKTPAKPAKKKGKR